MHIGILLFHNFLEGMKEVLSNNEELTTIEHTQEWLVFLRYSHLENKQTTLDNFKFGVSNNKITAY